jgi:uncharacterized Fe-S center protein
MDPLIASVDPMSMDLASLDLNLKEHTKPKKPKVPKEIQKLIRAFDNRKQRYFLIYLQEGELVTSSNIKTPSGIETLQQSIKNHYENL